MIPFYYIGNAVITLILILLFFLIPTVLAKTLNLTSRLLSLIFPTLLPKVHFEKISLLSLTITDLHFYHSLTTTKTTHTAAATTLTTTITTTLHLIIPSLSFNPNIIRVLKDKGKSRPFTLTVDDVTITSHHAITQQVRPLSRLGLCHAQFALSFRVITGSVHARRSLARCAG